MQMNFVLVQVVFLSIEKKCTKHERHECPRPLHDTVISFGDGLEECVLRPAFETLGILPNISRSKHLSFQSYSSYSEKREDFNFLDRALSSIPTLNQSFKVILQYL